MMNSKIGQIWIETVLYTLISLALIGLVLGFVMPKINQTRDKTVVDQTINMLNLLDQKINSAALTSGSARTFEFTLQRGVLYLNCSANKIVYSVTDLTAPYSEPGSSIPNGPIIITSEKNQKNYEVDLTLDYGSKAYNLTYNDEKKDKVFTPASNSYKLLISNKGVSDTVWIDISPTN